MQFPIGYPLILSFSRREKPGRVGRQGFRLPTLC